MQPKPDTTRLANLISAHAPYDGMFDLRLSGLYAIKVARPSSMPTHSLQQTAACIVAQGAKTVMIGDDIYEYGGGQVAVFSVDLPIASQITRASAAEPYLTLRIDFEPLRISELAAKVFPHGVPQPKETRALYVGEADAHIIDAATRLMEVQSHPADAELIAPLVIDEILIRLLRSPMGSRIAQMGQLDSSLHRIAKAAAWLRENYDQPLDVEELAKLVNMSVSTFHRQFKAVTSMSPLQFQKALRLQEARRLMLTSMLDAGGAGRRVGYVSASQFTREYGRFFGTSPTKDIHRLREQGLAAAENTAA
ncbi:MAG TPA: AraC family transcriptional regulator [Thermoanaerobaculia bacterium]|nr:AraC family transcriptional regulator [Thermoanaerobaculia bacterium]